MVEAHQPFLFVKFDFVQCSGHPARAAAFWLGATLSSRSSNTVSTSQPAAFWIFSRLSPGIKSRDRRAKCRCANGHMESPWVSFTDQGVKQQTPYYPKTLPRRGVVARARYSSQLAAEAAAFEQKGGFTERLDPRPPERRRSK
jgi:hypothetical protein